MDSNGNIYILSMMEENSTFEFGMYPTVAKEASFWYQILFFS